MTRRSKWGLGIVGALLLGALLLVLLFDWNWLRGSIEARLEEQLGREVSIEGDLDAEFSRTPRVVANDVVVANAEWGSEPHMLRLSRIAFVVDLWQLWQGQLDLWDIAVAEPDLLVERNDDGLLNWEIGPEEEEDAPPPIIGAFGIDDATIRYRGPQADREVVLDLASARGTGGRATQPVELEGQGTMAGLPLRLELQAGALQEREDETEPYPVEVALEAGETSLGLSGTLSEPAELTAADFRFQLDSPDPGPVFQALDLTVEPVAPPVSASGRLLHEGEVWAITELQLEVAQSELSGQLGVDFGEEPTLLRADLSSERLQVGPMRAFIDRLLPLQPGLAADDEPPENLIVNGRLNRDVLPDLTADIRFHGRNIEAQDAELDELRLHIELRDGMPLASLEGSGRIEEESVDLELRLGSEETITEPDRPYPVAARIEAEQTRLELNGNLGDTRGAAGLDLRLDLRSPTPGTLLELAGLPSPDLPPVALSGRLTQDGDVWRLEDLQASVRESDLSGQIAVDDSGPEPHVAADLTSEHMRYEDIQELVDALDELDIAPVPDEGPPLVSLEGPRPQIHPERLPDIGLEVVYRAARLEGPDLDLADVHAEVHLDEGLPTVLLSAQGTVVGEPVEIDVALGTSPDEAADEGPQNGYPIAARISAAQSRIDLAGRIEQPMELEGLELEFEAASPDPTRWLELANIAAPALPQIQTSGRLVQDGQVWQLPEVYLEVAGSNLFGEATVDLGAARPSIRADLESNRLIVEELRELVPEGAQGEDDDGGPPTDVELPALPEIDLDLALQVEHLSHQELRLEPLTAELRLREQVLVLDLSGEGWFHDTPMTVQAQLGSDEALDDPDAPYPVEASLTTAQTEVRAEGSVGEPIGFTGLQVDVSMQGENLEELGEILQLGLPGTPPYSFSTSLQHENGRWAFADLDGRIGESDIGGEVVLDTSGERLMVSADLHSDRLDFADVGGVVGEPPDPEAPLEEDEGALPEEEVAVPRLGWLDLQLEYAARNVVARQIPVDQVQLEARLEDGLLRIAPLGFELGVGLFTGELVLDTRQDPMQASADLRLRGADAEYIFDALEIELPDTEGPIAVGRLDARTRLEAQGNAVAEMAETLDGRLAGIVEGGWVTAVLVERLGMNLLEVLGLVGVDPEAMEPVRCFVANFDITGGVMVVEALVLDTEQSLITGAGEVDLGAERIDLALQSNPKDVEFPVLAPTPVEITGPFGEVEVGPEGGAVAQQFLAALGLGVVLPVVGAAIPFIEPGLAEDSNCAGLIQAAEAAAAPQAEAETPG